jgi:hypothetical protein
MPRTHYLQSTFNSGVLDPRVAGRFELQQYYQGLSRGENVLTRPTGGVRRRPGTRFAHQAAGQLLRHTGATYTMPNGGTAGLVNDDDAGTSSSTTTDVDAIDPYVVVHVDLGSALRVRFADAVGIKTSSGSTDEFRIQYSEDDSSWSDFGPALEVVDDAERTYRREGPVTARYWRIAKVGGSDLGPVTITLSAFSLFTELQLGGGAFAQSDIRLVAFEFNVEQRYCLAFTDRNIAVLERTGSTTFLLRANVRSPYTHSILRRIDAAQTADTMIVVHPDVAPQRLVRGGAVTLWSISDLEFTEIPQVDFNDDDSPTPVAAVQELEFAGTWKKGGQFEIEIDGPATRSISFAGTSDTKERETTAENIRREVQKLPTVGPTGVTVEWKVSSTFTITLGGASAGDYGLIGAFPTSGDGDINIVNVTNGVSRAEPAFSDTRGWPQSVTFYRGRLWFGGSRSLPSTVFGSQVIDFFGFDTGEGLDDEAIVQTVNSDDLNAIQYVFPGRNLQLFTTGGEARYTDEVLTPENAFPLFQTNYGAAKIRPVSIDGTTIFVQRTRSVVREFVFTLEEEAYLSPPLSALASFLIRRARDLAAWKGSGDDDSNLVLVVNDDGTIAVLNTLRAQDVAAWTQWTTQGDYKAATAVVEDIWLAVLRSGGRMMIEVLDESVRTDAAITRTSATVGDPTTVDGLGHLEGDEVYVVTSDGLIFEPQIVDDGEVEVSQSLVSTAHEAGLTFPWRCETMPLNTDFGNGANFMRRKRMVWARAYVVDTEALDFNGKRFYDRVYDEENFDEAAGVLGGVIEFNRGTEWQKELRIPFGGDLPARAEVLALDIAVESE